MTTATQPSTDPFRRVLADVDGFAERLPVHGTSADECATVSILLDAVRAWGTKHLDAAAIEAAGRIPAAVLDAAKEMGLFGLTIPEAYGGAGLSMKAACRVVEELATFDRSVAVTIGLHNGLGIRGLVQYGSEALKQAYLPRLATGELVAAFAATEPNAGSDIASVTTTGRLADDGTLRVTGSKIYVTNGGFADTFTIIARTPGLGGGRRGHSLLLLTKDLPGVAPGREEVKLGLKGSSTTTLDLDDVPVPLDRVIGEPAKGLDLMNQVLAWGRTLMAAGCLGSARASFRLAAEYATTRRQFGRPIAEFGQVAQKVADMRATIYAMESVQRLTNGVLDDLGADIGWESSVVKVFNSEGAGQVADDALQLHGGAGYIEETGLARILRDGRITRIFEGANEVLRFHLSSGSLGPGFQLDGAAPTLATAVHDVLGAPAARFDALYGATRETIAAFRKRWGFRAFQHQALLAGVADALIGLYTLLAVVLRTEGEVRARGVDAAAQELRLARYLADTLGRRVEAGLATAERDGDEALALEIAARVFAQF